MSMITLTIPTRTVRECTCIRDNSCAPGVDQLRCVTSVMVGEIEVGAGVTTRGGLPDLDTHYFSHVGTLIACGNPAFRFFRCMLLMQSGKSGNVIWSEHVERERKSSEETNLAPGAGVYRGKFNGHHAAQTGHAVRCERADSA